MVERYSHWAAGHGSSMIRYVAGEYVHHSDYADLERQLAEARAKTERLDRELNVSQMQETIGIERFQAAEAERDRLAADNARLREAGENLVRFFDTTGLDTNFLGELRAALTAGKE